MLKIDFSNLLRVGGVSEHGMTSDQLDSFVQNFDKYKAGIIDKNQGWIDYPHNKKIIEDINIFAKGVECKYDHVVVLGIGGSMLGPKCLVDALKTQSKPIVHCVDNVDPFLIEKISKDLDYNKTLFIVQTKSGTTPETIAQYLYFREQIDVLNLKSSEHFVFVTGSDGYLKEVATSEKIKTFEIPKNIGGRFSVLTPVGLLTASLVGLDINELMRGGSDISKNEFGGGSTVALTLAGVQHFLAEQGKQNVVLMPYSSRLKTFAEWYIQLLSESIGKANDINNKVVNIGLTPVPAVGATDQHSQLQLFKEGPFDKQIIFVELGDYEAEVKIPFVKVKDQDKFNYFKKASFSDLIKAELEGTRESLTESNRPNITIKIDKVDEYHLGALFVFFELATAFLGEIYNINAFDQPGVERSKILTKEILSK